MGAVGVVVVAGAACIGFVGGWAGEEEMAFGWQKGRRWRYFGLLGVRKATGWEGERVWWKRGNAFWFVFVWQHAVRCGSFISYSSDAVQWEEYPKDNSFSVV